MRSSSWKLAHTFADGSTHGPDVPNSHPLHSMEVEVAVDVAVVVAVDVAVVVAHAIVPEPQTSVLPE